MLILRHHFAGGSTDVTLDVEPNQFNIDAAVEQAKLNMARDSGYTFVDVIAYDFYSGDENTTKVTA